MTNALDSKHFAVQLSTRHMPMISPKLLRAIHALGNPTGTRRRKRWAQDAESKCMLGGGVSKLAFVHATPEPSEMWAVRYQIDGYSFYMRLKNRILAGYVARLIHAAADPERFAEKDGWGVNYYCECPAAETLYKAYDASVFRLRMPDGPADERDAPNIMIVDSWLANRIRGYSWFECNQKGMPDSWAVRPVVRVKRDTRAITVSWVTIESEIFPYRVKPLKKRIRGREMGFHKDGGHFVDLRVGEKYRTAVNVSPFRHESRPPGKKSKKIPSVIAADPKGKFLPQVGDVTIQKTFLEGFATIVDHEVVPQFPIRSRVASYQIGA